MCMCIYLGIKYILKYKYILVYTHTPPICAHTDTHMYMLRISSNIYVSNIHVYIYRCMHKHVYTHYTDIFTYVLCLYIHVHTYIIICTHICVSKYIYI